MLNSAEIIAALQSSGDDRIEIVPIPSLDGIKGNGASIDLRLGRWFESIRQTSTTVLHLSPSHASEAKSANRATRRHFVPFGEQFVLHPGRFVLAATLEWITLPSSVAGLVTGKSSLGRRGLIIETAAGVHPGFNGCLTLELANIGEVPVSISPGMLICQIFLYRLEQGGQPHFGTYSGQRRPILGDLSVDDVVARLSMSQPKALKQGQLL